MRTDDEEMLAILLRRSLLREFETDTYGNGIMFFPDKTAVREAKFILWLLDRYGAKEQAMEEAEQCLTLHLLQRQK
jgi:hypothetical protein